MRTTKAAILALASILSCRVARGGQQSNSSPSQVVITVTDPSGAGVAHTPMRIVPSPNPSAKMETDDKGRVSLNMKPGGYAVFVRGQGFKASATHVDVTASKELQTFSIVLTIASPGSPMVSPVSAKDGLLVLAYPYHEPIGFSFAELKTMPRTTVTLHNPHANADESYTGVLLADILAKVGAPLGPELRGESLVTYVVATGSDGYQAVLALAEVDPSFHSGEVLVADTMNGKPLDAHSGPFKLVVTEDKRPARSVRNLISIELRSAQ
jgi:hypothetical protein